MVKWIEKAQPPIVIIENVFGAPWNEKVAIFEERGYSATFLRLDTKDYYIPHTRQRGYLFAIKRHDKKNRDDQRPEAWRQLVVSLKRPASASLDDFMLPNDDHRVLRGRARLTAESWSSDGDRAGRTDWTKCETRHQAARSLEELGDARPLTEWSDSGNTTMPSFCWNEWGNAQVHRIHDLMDINTLRLAKAGIDCTHKTMVWNLSQNVDRDTMVRRHLDSADDTYFRLDSSRFIVNNFLIFLGKGTSTLAAPSFRTSSNLRRSLTLILRYVQLGLCQCLTPTGIPYVTNRGGPLVGEELLMLQGIPVDDLILTKETEDNLKDLAGNAMSTTVVGACMLCALLLGHSSLLSDDDFISSCDIVRNLGPRPLAPVSEVSISQDFGSYESITEDMSPRLLPNLSSWRTLLLEASLSARMCISEGQEEAISLDSLVQCRECGHSASVRNAFPPRKYEGHEYCRIGGPNRIEPSTFRRKLLDLLPMRVNIRGFDLSRLEKPEDTDASIWGQWLESVELSMTTAQQKPLEFRLTDFVRKLIWTAVYTSQDKSRLEARVSKSGVTWLLFAKSPAKDGPLKTLLDRPVARMSVAPKALGISMLDGQWEVCLPVTTKVSLIIQGVGEKVPSWRSRLGLKGRYETDVQYETLRVRVDSPSDLMPNLISTIEGDYKLLSKCGGACGSLRKKVCIPPIDNDDATFLFRSSGRKKLAKDDFYEFAPSSHRTAYGEYRESYLQIDTEMNSSLLLAGGRLAENSTHREALRATLLGRWIVEEKAELKEFLGGGLIVVQPISALNVPIRSSGWQVSPELLSCTFHVAPIESLVVRCRKIGGSVELNLQKSKRVFEYIAFATSRLRLPDLFQDEHWFALDQKELTVNANSEMLGCQKCAPAKPSVKWTLVSKGNKTAFVPVEDGREAAVYERALKARPQPWLLRLNTSPSSSAGEHPLVALTITIGCNAFSLAQRALGLFRPGCLARISMIDMASRDVAGESSHCTLEWRVVQHAEIVFTGFARLMFTSNKQDEQAAQPPHFETHKLRKEQLRSLTWMLKQESTQKPFYEEEVTEAVLPSLYWRAEGRVRRPVLVRGGIIADEVSS